METIRVLVVDDSAVMRRLVTSAIEAEADLEVVGSASNGKLALERIAALQPDVVTLDIEMPVMSGLEALRPIRQSWPRLPVIMCSTLTERGAAATLDALSLGASDYVTKPTTAGSITSSTERLRAELIPKIKALGARRRGAPGRPAAPSGTVAAGRMSASPPVPASSALNRQGSVGPIDIVAIGVSTGGPNALAAVICSLPGNLPVPVVIVQHMPPTFTKLLAQRLDNSAALTVCEAATDRQLQPGSVYLAPGDHHLVVARRGTAVWTATTSGPPENSCRPAVDVLFRSVADVYGGRSLAVVLTGMGHDGLAGARVIAAKGGRVIAQDEATSVVWGMPGAVAGAGLTDCLLPLDAVGPEIVKRAGVGRPGGPVVAHPAGDAPVANRRSGLPAHGHGAGPGRGLLAGTTRTAGLRQAPRPSGASWR